jgi:hypothetical protein
MSYQEIAKDMIDKFPADKMVYVINILENIGEMCGINFIRITSQIKKL